MMSDFPEELTEMTEEERREALKRYEIIGPYLEGDCSQVELARNAEVPVKTLQRWVRRYRAQGLRGLGDLPRSRLGVGNSLPAEERLFIEGLALQKPKLSKMTIHRQVCEVAHKRGWPEPSYRNVCRMTQQLSPALQTRAQEGSVAARETYDLLVRWEADCPNDLWQADHYKLPIWLVNEEGEAAHPWITIILDDYSRAVVGYRFTWTAPTALHTALTLRQAIMRKEDPRWPMHGIPTKFYTDHGRDFTSEHLEQIGAELQLHVLFSPPGVPRGRGKVERFFQTLEQLLLQRLPGYSPKERDPKQWEGDQEVPIKTTWLGLAELEYGFRSWLLEEYHQRVHSQTHATPQARWEEGNFVPRVPDSLSQLDLLLLTVSRERCIQQDGISFEGYRYIHPTLAAYVGEPVVVRYDPADMAEIRVYYHRRFLCRAICPELSGNTVSRADILAARRERREWERGQIRERRSVVRRFRVKRPTELQGFEEENEYDGEDAQERGKRQNYHGLKRYEHE